MPMVSWRRVKPLKRLNAVEEFERKYNCSLSDELKSCIIAYNGGRPFPKTIHLANGEENDVKVLLSFNEDDIEAVNNIAPFFMEHFHGELIPFATDSSGNYYCEQRGAIVLWTQNEEIFSVCDSFSAFLDSLYEL